MQEQHFTPDIPELPIVVIRRTYDPTCAWCLGEQGIEPLTGSHGTCPRHEAQMLAQAAQLKAARAERLQGGKTCS